ncbi:MAG TPA: hypothetical protein VNW51_09065 [Mucilaginibacter sp.]|jgi:hypothetical protein|nr:hypothetical protein [Mucilaginibacter sp.]
MSAVFLSIFVRTAIAQTTQTYPKLVGYFSAANPLATLSNGKIISNFSDVYTLNFLFGLNLIKSDKFGVSFEMAPSIRTENHISKVNSIAFSPGGIFRFKNNFAIVQRVAFETSGRFGFTTVFNKIVVKGKDASFFLAIPFGTRMGNNTPVSLTTSIQAGVFF